MFLENILIINFLICFTIYLINYKYRFEISKKLKIIDIPDNKRKFHKRPTPLNGSLWFIIFALIFLIESIFLDNFLDKNFRLIFISTIIVYIVGYVDDRKSINPNLRLLLYFITFYILVSLNENFQLNVIYFESLGFELKTSVFGTLFTAFCLTAFINSINLIDGINALANSIVSLILLIIFVKFEITNLIIAIFLFFLILNCFFVFKGKYFIGDSGSLSISTFVGLLIILNYNSKYSGINLNLFNAEDIFILMAFPGLDMIRVFFERLIKKKNPFHPSREHLHHYLLKKHSLLTTLIIYVSFAFAPAISNYVFQDLFYTTYNLFACIIFYIALLKYSNHINLKKIK